MARENQGLQIALIVSVMFTVILAASTYYCYRQWDDAETKAQSNPADAAKKAQEAAKLAGDVSKLKKAIGLTEQETVDAFDAMFQEDIGKYGAAYAEEDRVYRRLLAKMQETINERNAALADSKSQIEDLHAQIKVFEANKQPQIDDFQKARDAAAQDLAAEREKFNADRERSNQDGARLLTEVQNVRKEMAADKARAEAKMQEDGALIKDLIRTRDVQSDQIKKMTATTIESFNGEIRWVDQRNSTAWINLGRADSLPKQITFSVYPSDVTDLTTAGGGKKASIEVTQILGDHLAEARILEDTISNPIIPGDKIFTPLWSPGQKKHFAIAGVIDLYGDGKSYVEHLIDIIKLNDGVVDAYIDPETNKIVGAITVNTRFLILGDEPSEKMVGQIDAFSKMNESAKRMGVQTLQLGELLQRIGWKNLSPVVRYGPGLNPKDFAPKPESGTAPKSTGNVTELFKPRRPPGGTPEGTGPDKKKPVGGPSNLYHRF